MRAQSNNRLSVGLNVENLRSLYESSPFVLKVASTQQNMEDEMHTTTNAKS